MRKIKVLLLCFLQLYFGVVVAQNTSYEIELPFSCGFEDASENQNWVIQSGSNAAKCIDQWRIGNLDYREGYNCMYISSDGGNSTNFGVSPNCVVAYRPFVIPQPDTVQTTRCKINVSFSWKGGVAKDNLANLRYYLLPNYAVEDDNGVVTELNSNFKTAVLPDVLNSTRTMLTGSKSWTYQSFDQNLIYGTKYYLIFAWQNTNVDSTLMDIAACIDDIQITSANCPKPHYLKVTALSDTLIINWDGDHQKFDLEYRKPGMTMWNKMYDLEFELDSSKQIILPSLPEGLYDVRVRGVCGNGEKSPWITEGDVVVFCPDRHCINYVKLDNNPDVTCMTGFATDPSRGPNSTLKPTKEAEGKATGSATDFGSKDIRSRHTVNWKQNEFDPRTGNGLRTVPEGSLASIRLGNWKGGAQAEGISYKIHVDTAVAKIILMKYAVVLEAPGHGEKMDPNFRLVLKDKDGELISTECAAFDFTPENENIKWTRYNGYVWKDWTAIGLNISNYDKQDIYVELITQDCLMSAHGGYAYFTLDCADAAIKNNSCGETVEMQMVAPDGFKYFWTRGENPDNVSNPTIISREKEIDIPADDIETYYCRVEYIDVGGCGFTMHTEVKPRLPHADFDWEWKPQNCKNRVVLKNKSCVYTRIDNVDTPTDEPCETFHWIVNDGEMESIDEEFVIPVPQAGGNFKVKLIVGLSNGVCQDSIETEFSISAIGDTTTYVSEINCENEPEIFGGQYLVAPGTYTAKDTTWCGCDSSTVMDLTFVPLPEDTYFSDIICGDEPYYFHGRRFVESVKDTAIWLKTTMGCDSVVFLTLDVVEPLGISINNESRFVCADEQSLLIDFDTIPGSRLPSKYSVVFDDFEQQNGFTDQQNIELDVDNSVVKLSLPDNCRPNSYTATLLFKDSTAVCGDISIPVNFDVYYSSSILYPKFGNLIAIADKEHNGGYEFVDGEYKWYKNDQLIDTVVSSFYYLSDGSTFNGEDCYYMIPKRADDGVAIRTCKICPDSSTPVEDIYELEWLIQTTMIEKGQPIFIQNVSDGRVNIYSFTGLLITSSDLDNQNNQIIAPGDSGFYIVQIKTEDKTYVYKIWVR